MEGKNTEQASHIILEWVKHFFFMHTFIKQQLWGYGFSLPTLKKICIYAQICCLLFTCAAVLVFSFIIFSIVSLRYPWYAVTVRKKKTGCIDFDWWNADQYVYFVFKHIKVTTAIFKFKSLQMQMLGFYFRWKCASNTDWLWLRNIVEHFRPSKNW